MKPTVLRIIVIGIVSGCFGMGLGPGCGSSPTTVGVPSPGTASGTGSTSTPSTFNLNAGTTGTTSNPSGAGGASGVPSSAAGTCGSSTTDTTRAQSDVLIVLDNTNSMESSITSDNTTCSAGAANCQSRISVVATAVGDVVVKNPGINWGLQLLLVPSDTGTCAVYTTPQVGVGPNNEAAIKSQLASVKLGSSTPTRAALNAATAYLKTVGDGNNKAILLATDGEPNCAASTTGAGGRGGGGSSSWNTNDLQGASSAADAANKAGFPVYVVGIGPSTSNLQQLAQSGGTQHYYPATSTSELGAALASIAKVVSATCTFKADTVPPDKNLVYVYVDKSLVPQSDSSGWRFEASDASGATITLTGSYCDDMLAGRTSQVQIVFGCRDVPPLTVIP